MSWWLYSWKVHLLVALLAVGITYYIIPFLLYLVFVLLAVLGGGALAVLQHSGPYVRRGKRTYPEAPFPTVEGPLSKIKPYPPPSIRPTLLSPNVDAQLQRVLDLSLKHHAIPTYEVVGQDQEAFFNSVVPEIWNVLAALLQRMGQMDTMKLISQDVVETLRNHFEHFRGIHFRDTQPRNPFPNLKAFPYLESPEAELNFLRQVCEVLLCVLLSRDLLECTPVRVLIREFLTCRILQPTIDMVCDPDYINQKLLAYLEKRDEAVKSAQSKYAYKTYEDFIKHIKKCDNLMELQEIRQFIITDIIQAKAVYKMKSSRMTGLHGNRFPIPIPADKVRTLMDRDLELYINQLGTTKTVTERQILKLGGADYQNETSAENSQESHISELPLGIPFETIMNNEGARTQLLAFLEQCGFANLLCCWISIDMLHTNPLNMLHTNIESIYGEYLSQAAPSSVHADPSLVSAVQKSLTMETTASEACSVALTAIKKDLYTEINEHFYHNFIASEQYKELMTQSVEGADGGFPAMKYSESMRSDSPTMDDSRYKQKLKSLKMKLEEKDGELSLMPREVRQSQSLTQRKKALQKVRFTLEDEIKKLEHYIEHTEEWFGTVGQWTVEIHTVDLSNNDRDPLFIIVVHRPNASRQRAYSVEHSSLQGLEFGPSPSAHLPPPSSTDSEDGTDSLSEISEEESCSNRAGWVLGRHLHEFEDLHRKVVNICPELQFPPLPRRLNVFQKPDAQSSYWQKYRLALQSYLVRVLQDDKLQENEEVFNFVSPASDNLHKDVQVERKPAPQSHRFSLSVPITTMFTTREQHDDVREDSVTEYVYLLISEVFELDEWSRVLRKQLVELVQLTYGKSIDRELQEFINWVVSEPMLVFYLETFQGAMWPNGEPVPAAPTRSDEQKTDTKEKARQKFLKSVPSTLQTILGQRNCQIGFQKIFESFQDPRGNRQLFYSLLEMVLYALVPELEKVEIDQDNGSDWQTK